ncbi:MAG: transglycosylase domain-containing protein [Prevotella sp.]|nr:transglycosylase domain-containing protein [Prevotella sp.]
MRKWFIRILWTLLLLGVIATGIVFWAIADGRIGYMPPIEELQNPINRFASQVYSADGKMLGTYSLSRENRVMVNYDQLPRHLVEALVATEDARYFDHAGIDFWALGRAIIKRGILRQKSAGGGSTITQQLAKQLFSDVAHSTAERLLQKPIEWVIAVKLERHYTKEEIIAMYLNYFDFLNNAVGIKTASNTYFSKEPSELSITEAATLVGMCKNPSYFNPRRYTERSEQRRNIVLRQMCKEGYLTEAEMDSCMQVPLKSDLKFHVADHNDGQATYFRDFLRRYMMAKEPSRSDYPEWNQNKYTYDKIAWDEDPLYGWCNKNKKSDGTPYNVYTDGLKIYTTIDTRMQKYAEEACYEHVVGYLQPVFNKGNKNRRNAPYSNTLSATEVKRILKRNIRQCERYRVMKEYGATQDEIDHAFNTPTKMTVFTYNGDRDTIMTPLDSILYYKSFLRTGFFSMDPRNGHVKAYVGGLDFQHFAYDMATEGRRQVGSTIKPFLYSLAMMPSGGNMTPCTEVPCIQKTYYTESGQAWTPRNGSRAREGEMVTLKWGLQTSNNWVSAYLIDVLRPKNFLRLLRDYGFNNPDIFPGPALCLGPCENTVAEMVSAYTTFVNHGYRSAPIYVTKIVDSEGKEYGADVLARPGNEVIDAETAERMIYLLRGVVDGGTGARLRRAPYNFTADMGGKTGTTNSNSDGWFMGITPKLVSGCWVGGDDRDIHFESMAYAQGAAAALPVFGLYMKKVYADKALGISQSDEFSLTPGFDPCKGEDDMFFEQDEDEDYEDEDEGEDPFETIVNELFF